MDLFKYNVVDTYAPSTTNELKDVLDLMNRVNQSSKNSKSVKYDIYTRVTEDKEYLVFEVALPGYEKEDIKVNQKYNELFVKAEATEKELNDGEKYIVKGITKKDVKLRWQLGENYIDTPITAKFENGILYVLVEKKEEPLDNDIEIL